MKIQACGAAGEVTGSNYYLSTETGTQFLVDFGLFQGPPRVHQKNRKQLPYSIGELDFVILTHAHIDHSGRLAMLHQGGFRGKIYMTHATLDLIEPMLLDAAKIQEESAHPLYTVEDTKEMLAWAYPVKLGERIQAEDVSFVFRESGHLLGSAFVEIQADGISLTLSGDLGRYDQAFYPAPAKRSTSDFLICESTYGSKLHPDRKQAYAQLYEAIQEAFHKEHTIILPAFSIGRSAELLHGLHRYVKENQLEHDFYKIPIFLDSPLAILGLSIYLKRSNQLSKNVDPSLFELPNLELLDQASESFAMDKKSFPKLFISASGMAQGGHILHHLKQFLPMEKTTVIFTGYQGEETLGRAIQEGQRELQIGEETLISRAEVVSIGGFSGHADQEDLLRWIRSGEKPQKIYLTHGETETLSIFRDTLIQQGYDAEALIEDDMLEL